MAEDRVVEQLDADLLEVWRLNDELAGSNGKLPDISSHSKLRFIVKKLGMKVLAPFFRLFMNGQIRINHLMNNFTALVLNNRRDIARLEARIKELEKKLGER
jgi:hypothetical protein